MMRLLLTLAVTLTLLAWPLIGQAQSPAATPGQPKLTPGVPPCLKGDLGLRNSRLMPPKQTGDCAKFAVVQITSLGDWQALKPYMSTQDALIDISIKLPVHEMEDVLKSVPDPSKLNRIRLEKESSSRFDTLPTSLSRFNNVFKLILFRWDGDTFPDPWRIGVNPKEFLVNSLVDFALPRSVFEQPKLKKISFLGSNKPPLALKLMNIPKAEKLTRKLVGLPAGICSQRNGPSSFTYTRKGKPDLKIYAPYINHYCPPASP